MRRNAFPKISIVLAFASVTPLVLLGACSGRDPILSFRAPNPPQDSGRDRQETGMAGEGGADATDGEAGQSDAPADAPADTMMKPDVQDSGIDAPDDATD